MKSRALLQERHIDNAFIVMLNFVRLLKIPVSETRVQKVQYHPSYPSLLAISDELTLVGIENIATKITLNQLQEIPLPSIAHLNKNGGHFVVLEKLDQMTLTYFDPEVGIVEETLSEFEKKWTGVVLLAEVNSKSGEDGYHQKKRIENFNKASFYLSCLLVGLGLFVSLFFATISILPYFFLKIIGALLSFFLLQKQFGLAGKNVSKLCSLGGQSGCDAVIQSPHAKLFGVLNLSEIGMLYFSGSLLALSLLLVSGIHDISVLQVISVSLVPFTLVSIYYQWRVIKAWCPLCLLVMVVICLEALTVALITAPLQFNLRGITLTFFGFSLPVVGWFLLRQRYLDSFQLPNLEKTLFKFNRSERIFQLLLNNQPVVKINPVSIPVSMASPEAPLCITLVSNPACGPCAYAHAVVEDLVERFNEKIKVDFRFTVDQKNPHSAPNSMIKHILEVASVSNDQALAALHSWFIDGGRANLNSWKKTFPVSNQSATPEEIDKCLFEYAEFIFRAEVQSTPSIFINGRRMPDEFSIADLNFQIRKLIELIPEPSTTLVESTSLVGK